MPETPLHVDVTSGKTLADYEAQHQAGKPTHCRCCGWRLGPRALISQARGVCIQCWFGMHRPECGK